MLLNQLKEILDIDTRIGDMHRELANLYAIRSSMIEPEYGSVEHEEASAKTPTRTTTINHDLSTWSHQEYDKLVSAWGKYDIAIPSYKSIQPKIIKAHSIMAELVAARPELNNNLSIVLVPPTKVIGFPLKAELRDKRGPAGTIDYLHPDIAPPPQSKKWQLLVVYTAEAGLYLGSPETILTSKNYLINKHDTRGLGLLEYTAINLQLSTPTDSSSWTILLKDIKPDANVPCVTFQDGRLRFDIEDIDSVFGDDRFRPAVIIG